jgi:hypothetical protein
MGELEADALGDNLLLAAGVDEEEVLLTVVEEPEVAGGARRAVGGRRLRRARGRAEEVHQVRGGLARRRGALLGHESEDALECLRGHAGAVAQARDELAVVHRAPSERRFGHAALATERGDAVEQRRRPAYELFHLFSHPPGVEIVHAPSGKTTTTWGH